ncbi:MAG: hypothetical protein ACFFD1_13265 [Candidatus Thorarchaeota archaeon]
MTGKKNEQKVSSSGVVKEGVIQYGESRTICSYCGEEIKLNGHTNVCPYCKTPIQQEGPEDD